MTDENAPTIASGGGVVRRILCALLATIALIQGKADAMVVNGTEMKMDHAIMAASQSPSVSGLMQDANVVRVEMDMLLKSEVWASMMRERENSTRRRRRKAIRDQSRRWPGAIIPYQIAVSWTHQELEQFQQALNDYHEYTCVRFRQATPTDRDFVRVVDGSGCCSSDVGRHGGPQTVTLARGCRHKGDIIHELGHAVGFYHEHSRPDRDDYVHIVLGNVNRQMRLNFDKLTDAQVETASVPYDYLSVMHYGENAFGNGRQTIRTVDRSYQSHIGQREGLSFRDIELVNAIYGCAARNRCPERQCPGEGFLGPDCVCWCRSTHATRPVIPCSGQTPTTSGPATMSPCADGRSECATWARLGHCSSSNAQYREIMYVSCKASCNLCSGRPTVAVTTTARPSTAAPPCADDHYLCPDWARQGYCSHQNRRNHCNASCNLCSVTPASL